MMNFIDEMSMRSKVLTVATAVGVVATIGSIIKDRHDEKVLDETVEDIDELFNPNNVIETK